MYIQYTHTHTGRQYMPTKILYFCSCDLILPCSVTIVVKFGVTLIFIFNLSAILGKNYFVIAVFVVWSHSLCKKQMSSGVPSNFVRGWGVSTNSVEDRENGDLGAVAP